MKNKKKEIKKRGHSTFLVGLVATLVVILVGLLGYIAVSKIQAYRTSKKIVNDLEEYIQPEGISVVLYASSSCEYCEMARPILKQLTKDYDFEYFEIDYLKLTDKDRKKVLEKLDIEGKTPTLVIFKDQKPIATQVGYVDGYKLVEFLIKAGVLEEGATYKPEENITFIEYDEFENLRHSETPVVVGIGTSICEYCRAAKPILSNLSKAYDVPIYYVTFNYLALKERENVMKALAEMGYDEESFVQNQQIVTPTVFIFQNNQIVSYLGGLKNVTEYTKFLRENNVITKS